MGPEKRGEKSSYLLPGKWPASVSLDVVKTAAFVIFNTDTHTLYLRWPVEQFLECNNTDTLTLYPQWPMAPL